MHRAITLFRGGNGFIVLFLVTLLLVALPPAPALADGCAADGTLHGTTFLDGNANGSREATESGIGGVDVVALGADGVELGVCTTDEDGAYGLAIAADAFPVRLEFRNLPAPLQPGPVGPDSGAAVDVVAQPQAYGLGLIDAAKVCQDASETACTPAQVELGNRVWLDENGDGYQDADEPGFMGLIVNVYIVDSSGGYMLRATTVTDADGRYLFSALEPATTYFIVVEDVSTEDGGGDLLGGPLGPSLGADLYQVNTPTAGSELPWAGYPYYEYTVGTSGDINHDLDFAFAPEALGGPTAITWNNTSARSLLQSPFVAALLLLAVLLGCLWLVLRSLVFGRRQV